MPGDMITRIANRGWCLTEHCAVPRPGREETLLHGLKPEARLGRNPWVTRAMSAEIGGAFGEEGVYYAEYQDADARSSATCANGHPTWLKPSVGTYVCPTCGKVGL